MLKANGNGRSAYPFIQFHLIIILQECIFRNVIQKIGLTIISLVPVSRIFTDTLPEA